MQKLIAAAAALALVPVAAQAQDHSGHAGHAAPATAQAALTLDTPVEAIIADAQGKAVLDKHLPGMTAHPQFEQAKTMSLRQISGFAPEHITAELLAKVEADLAAIK
jgi:hypothetical protein